MALWDYKNKPANVKKDADLVVATPAGWTDSVTGEVLVAARNLEIPTAPVVEPVIEPEIVEEEDPVED